MRQLITEAVLLAIMGGLAGIALASLAVDVVTALSPSRVATCRGHSR